MRCPPLLCRLTGICLLLAVILLDQWSKAALVLAAEAGSVPLAITSFFNLVIVHNHGISFGFFAQGKAWLPQALTLMTSLVALLLLVWLVLAQGLATCLALGFIVGGAAGNIIDRLRYGSVTDFLDFHWQAHHWPAFNIADSSIFIGVVILVLISIVGPAKTKENVT